MPNDDFYKLPQIKASYSPLFDPRDLPKVNSPSLSHEFLRAHWGGNIGLVEEFKILYTDYLHRPIGIFNLAKGGYNTVVIDLRLAFAIALTCKASSMTLAHNHPSGRLKPSYQDHKMTKELMATGDILIIKINDHIILSPFDNEYFSFMDTYGECLEPD